VVAGYASVELVDKQGDLITRSALKDAFKKFMTEPKYRNVQLAHSNIQVGEVIPNYTDTEGRMWKSEVDDAGMFVVVQLRNDIEKAREVAAEVRKGNLTGFSIGGQAFKRVNKSDNTHGSYQEISKLELHEITICEKGINPEATFKILKEDKNNKVTKMTDDVMEQMNSVLERLEGRLDSMEKGEMPPGLKEHMKNKKGDEKKEDKDDAEKGMDKMKDEEKMYGKMEGKMEDEDDKKKSEFSDVITAEYLDWMENTLKSAGVDTAEARMHFDNLAKANLGSTPESIGDGADYFAGQVKGREQESGSPSTNALQRAGLMSGGKEVTKGDFLTSVDPASAEEAYAIFKAAKQEEELRKALEGNFEARYAEERTAEITKAQAQEFDARGPLGEVMKALDALNERIDNIGSSVESSTIAKADSPSIEVPSTADLANMSWEEVHRLAGGLFTE
tara:strand:- start:491 stop:1834 length:1344 start_codon:yes stop_codon:yes gene_type:complete